VYWPIHPPGTLPDEPLWIVKFSYKTSYLTCFTCHLIDSNYSFGFILDCLSTSQGQEPSYFYVVRPKDLNFWLSVTGWDLMWLRVAQWDIVHLGRSEHWMNVAYINVARERKFPWRAPYCTVQWVTKVMTPSSMVLLWTRGSWLIWLPVHGYARNFIYGTKLTFCFRLEVIQVHRQVSWPTIIRGT